MNAKSQREWLGAVFATAASSSFAIVLFLSPLAFRVTLVERRIWSIYESYTDFFIYPHDFFAASCLVFGALALLVQKRAPRGGPASLTLPLGVLVGLSWLGVFTGIDAPLVMYHALRLSSLFVLYLFLVNFNPAPSWFAVSLGAALVIEALVALWQFQFQHSLGLHALGELTLDPQLDGTSIVRDGALRILRAYGLTDHPNLLGGFFAFALILILGYYFAAAHSRARYFILVPLALGTAALVLTFSRAANLATLVGICFLGACVLWDRQTRAVRWKQVAPVSAVMLTAAILPMLANSNLIVQRSGQNAAFAENSGEIRSLDERGALLASAARLFSRSPLWGVGNGALPVAMYSLDPEFDTTYPYQPVHIVWMEVAAELGVLGAAAWGVVLCAPWIVFFTRGRPLLKNAWVAAAAAALLAFTLIGFLDYYPWLLPQGRIWQWTILGLVGAALATRA